ncbi:hypothetical protein [Paenibacillus odorifer]|uniref:hypothetical protein n=1 Tax=Paenibacillus odorifer TaxID=189426 RepID=UPI00096D2284|nr:hypothetical protein [Paenibacillus odorifer]OMD78254.1 hypothetical protein BSK50_10930 [Paenibacillus odorifer]
MKPRDKKTEVSKLEGILKACIGNKVRFRVDGIVTFTNEILKDYIIGDSDITIVMEQESITTNNYNEVSFTHYEDRVDFWIYGDRTSRFNLQFA